MRIVLITLCLYLCCLISCKIFLTLPSLIDREPNVKMLIFFANSENRKKKKKKKKKTCLVNLSLSKVFIC